jgi:hypothetical protein
MGLIPVCVVVVVLVIIAVVLSAVRRASEAQGQLGEKEAAKGIDPELTRAVAVVAVMLLVLVCLNAAMYLPGLLWQWWLGW